MDLILFFGGQTNHLTMLLRTIVERQSFNETVFTVLISFSLVDISFLFDVSFSLSTRSIIEVIVACET